MLRLWTTIVQTFLLKSLRMPCYPWLAGAYPILHLYSVNYGRVIDREVPIAMLWVLAATTFCYIAAYTATRYVHISALITMAISLCFSLSGHVYRLVAERESLVVWTLMVLIVAVFVVAELLKMRDVEFREQFTLVLNLIASAMILMQAITLFAQYSDTYANPLQSIKDEGTTAAQETAAKIHDSSTMPDIYFIIPDGYPSDAWLKSEMNFDNGAFTEALLARGFVVAPHAQSNYGTSLPSLAALLNMRHFNSNPSEFSEEDYLRLAISDSKVAHFLQQQGYTYVQLLSGYFFPSPIADINRDFTPDGPIEVSVRRDELTATLLSTAPQNSRGVTDLRFFHQRSFLTLYIETTLLRIAANRWSYLFRIDRRRPYDLFSPHRFLESIDEINTIVAMPEATFTFVHLLKPHRPIVFDGNGRILEKRVETKRKQEAHLEEFKFINRKFIEMIDTILEGSPHQPVIIFQADHGSKFGEIHNPADDGRFVYFDVYSAFYLPDRYRIEIPQPFTTINTFPLILNSVFDASFEFSENRLFEISSTVYNPLDQKDVTESFANWLN